MKASLSHTESASGRNKKESVRTRKRISLIGATGSIGTSTLEIVRRYPERYEVVSLTAGSKVKELAALAREFRPKLVAIADSSKAKELENELFGTGIEINCGDEAVASAASATGVEQAVIANVGFSGLRPALNALEHGLDIALANKESLVVAGQLVTSTAKANHASIYPIDSEHSAIAQCLIGENPANINRIIITASGGPFRTWSRADIADAPAEKALAHPNWSMGAKITIDSATMINKAFEIIEAGWLFDIPITKIEPVVHPQSIVHSMVEFSDGAVKAQLGVPDMKLPIAYALGCSTRLPGVERKLTLDQMSSLTFEAPDREKFPCLDFAKVAYERGGSVPCVINAANEVAVHAYLRGEIKFYDIPAVIHKAVDSIEYISEPKLEDYLHIDSLTRMKVSKMISTRDY